MSETSKERIAREEREEKAHWKKEGETFLASGKYRAYLTIRNTPDVVDPL